MVVPLGKDPNAMATSSIRRSRSTGIAATLLVLALPIALTACGSDSTTSSNGGGTTTSSSSSSDSMVPNILDGTYTSTSVTGYDLVAGSTITLDFSGVELSFNAGCNRMSGNYVITDGVLTLTGDPISTMMGCAADLQAQDQWLSGLLTAGVEVTETETTLTLTGSGATIELTSGATTEGVELSGTAWNLTSVVAQDTASSLPAGGPVPTLTIGADGTAAVFTGCNSGSASVTTSADGLVVGPLQLTMMACAEPVSQIEATIVATLSGDVAYVIEGNTLTLTKDGTSLVYTAGL